MLRRTALVVLVLMSTGLVAAPPSAASVIPSDPDLAPLVTGAAGTFVPLDPARVLDTRIGDGAVAGPVLPDRTLDVTLLGRGGIPTGGVAAVVLTVTVTDTVGAGFVTAFPSDASPPLASSLNYVSGQTVANQVTVALGADGGIGLRVGGTTQSVSLVADVSGWYRAGTPTAAGAFVGETPTRLLDTRTTSSGLAPSTAAVVPVAGHGGVPAEGVSAVVVNLTVADPTTTGFLTAFPTSDTVPLVSSLNLTPGRTVANQATVPLADDGSIALFAGGTNAPLSVVIDVTGWYLDGDSTNIAGAFVPVRPTRTVDTRLPGNDAHWNSERSTGNLLVPLGSELIGTGTHNLNIRPADTVLANLTVTNTVGSGVLTAWPSPTVGLNVPGTSSLNWDSAQTVAAQATLRLGESGRVYLTQRATTATADVVVDIVGYFIATPPPPVPSLRATVTAHTVTLTWQTTPDAPGVSIFRRTPGAPEDTGSRFDGVYQTFTSLCMDDARPGTTYQYQVLAATNVPVFSLTSTDITVTTPTADPPGFTPPC